MTNFSLQQAVLLLSLTVVFPGHRAFAEDATEEIDDTLSEITVKATRVVNDSPASSYATAATALRFDPLTELQSRGLAEGQSDVTVRGGLFENTGFMLGAVTVMDPQTGHYAAGLPVDPAIMTVPAIYKGIDGAVTGFNSTVATVSYGFARVTGGGTISLGAGSDNLNHQQLRFGHVSETSGGKELGINVSAARSEGDGSVPFGDHKFSRANVQLQLQSDAAQTDLIVAFQDKFFGWPGAYTGFANLPEIDDTQTTLLLANHKVSNEQGWLEVGGYYRRLEDNYDFNRANVESGTPGSFEHETKVSGVGFQGLQRRGRVSWRFGAQLTTDELVRSTDLTNGQFTKRTYATATIVPSFESELDNGDTLIWRAGATVDYSNRDDNEVSPLLGLTLRRFNGDTITRYKIEYAATSQVPGYTALNSNPSGLFGGNPLLGRETAKQLSASVEHDSGDWQLRAAVFSRQDDDLVDWTYAVGAPFARQANPVDIDVLGLEVFLVRKWESVDLVLGFTTLDKDAEYGDAQVDASFYALNFAKYRATVAFAYRFANAFEFRVDSEYRTQEDNPLREGDDSTFLASAALVWQSDALTGFGASLIVDNVTDSEFQPFPGTPASGRQVSLNASYSW